MDETSRVDQSNVTHRTLTVASDRNHQEQIDQEYYDVAIVNQERNRTVLPNKIDSSKNHHTLFNAVDDDNNINTKTNTSTTQQLQHPPPNTDHLDIEMPLSAVALNTTTTPAVVTPSRHEINTSSTMIPPIWNTTTTTSRTLPTTSNNKNTSFIDPNHTESLYISSGSVSALRTRFLASQCRPRLTLVTLSLFVVVVVASGIQLITSYRWDMRIHIPTGVFHHDYEPFGKVPLVSLDYMVS